MQVSCDYKMSKKRESCKEKDVFFDWNDKIYQDKHFFRIMVGDFRQRMVTYFSDCNLVVSSFDCTGIFIICCESGNLSSYSIFILLSKFLINPEENATNIIRKDLVNRVRY